MGAAVPIIAGGAIGALGHWLGGKPKDQVSTTTEELGGADKGYIDFMRSNAQRLAGQNWMMDPAIRQAMQGYGQYANAGNTGLAGLMGDPKVMARMMGPGQGLLDRIFSQQQRQGGQDIQRQLTAMGAMGNRRGSIPLGDFYSRMAGQRAQGTMGLLSDAYSRMGNLANMGLYGNQGLGGLGQFASMWNPNMAQIQQGLLTEGFGRPESQTQTTTTPMQGNSWLQDIAGGAMAGAGLGFGRGGAKTSNAGAGLV